MDQENTGGADLPQSVDERASLLSELRSPGDKGDPLFRTKCIGSAVVSGLKDAPFRLLVYLLMVGDTDGGNSFKKRKSLAKDLGWSISKLESNLSLLRRRGWLRFLPYRGSGNMQTSSLYCLSIPKGEKDGPLAGAVRCNRKDGAEPLLIPD